MGKTVIITFDMFARTTVYTLAMGKLRIFWFPKFKIGHLF